MKKSKTQKTSPQQVRGEELKDKMKDSEEYGEKFRAQNQGKDVVKPSSPSENIVYH